jgi:hypothetical protein
MVLDWIEATSNLPKLYYFVMQEDPLICVRDNEGLCHVLA